MRRVAKTSMKVKNENSIEKNKFSMLKNTKIDKEIAAINPKFLKNNGRKKEIFLVNFFSIAKDFYRY